MAAPSGKARGEEGKWPDGALERKYVLARRKSAEINVFNAAYVGMPGNACVATAIMYLSSVNHA